MDTESLNHSSFPDVWAFPTPSFDFLISRKHFEKPTQSLAALKKLTYGKPLVQLIEKDGVELLYVPDLYDAGGVYKAGKHRRLIAVGTEKDPTVLGHEARHHQQAKSLEAVGIASDDLTIEKMGLFWTITILRELDAFSCQAALAIEHLRNNNVLPSQAKSHLKGTLIPTDVRNTVLKYYGDYYESQDPTLLKKAMRESFDNLLQSGWVLKKYRSETKAFMKAKINPALQDQDFASYGLANVAYGITSSFLSLRSKFRQKAEKRNLQTQNGKELLSDADQKNIADLLKEFGSLPNGSGNYLFDSDMPKFDHAKFYDAVLDKNICNFLQKIKVLQPQFKALHQRLRNSVIFDPKVRETVGRIDSILGISLQAQMTQNQIEQASGTSVYDL